MSSSPVPPRRALGRAATASLSVAALVTAGLLAGAGAASAAPAAGNARIPLPQSVSPALAHSQAQGDLSGTQKLTAAVSLKLRNSAQLEQFITSVSTPGSADYGHYLTAAQFNAAYAPTTAQVDQVKAYLSGQGLTVTKVSANRQVIDVSGSTSKVEAAFGTKEVNYLDKAEQRHFYANSGAPTLPADIASIVQGVSGLDNHTVPQATLSKAQSVAPNASSGGFGPSQYDGAYRLDQLSADGTGQTVALVEFDGYNVSDLTTYDSQYGLSGPAPTTVSVDGADYDSSPGPNQVEVVLDSDIVRGVAPKANQLIYEAPGSDQGQLDIINQIVSENRASVISDSWASCEPLTTPSLIMGIDNAMAQADAQGISMYSASGDNGSAACEPSNFSTDDAVLFPASSPHGTGVGGTTLTLSGTSYGSEKAWSGSGGGVSTLFTKPSWQTGTGNRTVPDVSANADFPNSPYNIYYEGAWNPVGGTSAAAPLWGAFTALINQKAAVEGKPRVGFANPALYQIANGSGGAAAFHDVTSGSNGSFSAGVGYDEVTGLGSPIGDALATALLGDNTVAVTNPGNQTTVVNTAASLQIHASDSASGQTLTYSATGLPAGLSVNTSSGLISGTPTATGAFNVTVTAKDSTGGTGNVSFTWTVANSGCTTSQLLTNPGFESGNTGWSASPGVIGDSTSVAAYAGSYKAWLDGYGKTHTDTLSQSVTIPAKCTSANLSFYLYIFSNESTTTSAFDTLTVAAGSTTLATYSNLDHTTGYVQKSIDLSSFIGKTVTLKFTGTEDSSLATSFLIDDTAVNAS